MPIIGTQQSPIRIETDEALHVAFGATFLEFRYKALHGHIDPEKRIFRFDPPKNEGSAAKWSIRVGSETWLIRQIHVHATAEHLVEGDAPDPFEAHLVHSLPGDPCAAGRKLAVGVFVRPGDETRKKSSLESLAKKLPRAVDAQVKVPHRVNPWDFLPDSNLDRFYRYEGSLTSGTFSEDVSWIVMTDDGIVAPRTFAPLEAYAEQESRIVQPLNRRFVLKSFA